MDKPLLIVVSLCLAAPAFAQTVYKSIGPDGKVIYTDKPTGAKTESSIAIKPSNPGNADLDLGDDPEDDKVRFTPAQTRALKAAVTVSTQAETIEFFEKWCAKEDPSSLASIQIARSRWTQQHAALIRQAEAVTADLLKPQQIRRLRAQVGREQIKLQSSLATAPKEERSKWCQVAPITIASPEMSLTRNSALSTALNNYRH